MVEYISDEWAKQLAFDVWGDLDFPSIKVIKVPQGISVYRLPVVSDVSWRHDLRSGDWDIPEVDEVHLDRIGDPVNGEYTHLGYGKKSNTLCLGFTYKVG